MYDVFLSYARQEREQAKRIYDGLTNAGFSVFYDVSSLEAGKSFADTIDQAVKSAAVVVGLWSPLSIERPWVRTECRVGLARNVLLPVAIAPLDSLKLPVDFYGIHWFDLVEYANGNSSRGWLQFESHLRGMIGKSIDDAQQSEPVEISSGEYDPLRSEVGSSTAPLRWARVRRETSARWLILMHDLFARIEYDPNQLVDDRYFVNVRWSGGSLLGELHLNGLATPKRFRVDDLTSQPGIAGYQLRFSAPQLDLPQLQVRWLGDRADRLSLAVLDEGGTLELMTVDDLANFIVRSISRYVDQRPQRRR